MNITSGKIVCAQKITLYGVEGIGKTSFAAQFPDPLFIDTEGGSKHLDVKRLEKPSSWTMFQQQVAWVKNNPQCCSTLVIDTIDWAEQLCIEHICAQHQKTGLEGWDYGKGYTYLAEEFGKMLNRLTDLTEVGVNVLLVAHSKVKKEERPEEYSGYDRWMLKLSDSGQKKVSPLVKEWSDALLFMNYKMIIETTKGGKGKARGNERAIYTNHHPCWDAKNRWGLPDEIPLDYSLIAPHIPTKSIRTCDNSPVQNENTTQQAIPQPTPSTPPMTAGTTTTFNSDGSVANVEPRQMTPPQNSTSQSGHLKPLLDLMAKDGISDEEVRDAVANKGWKTIETPMANYEPDFVAFLVTTWSTMRERVEARRVPFNKPKQ